MHSHQYYVEYWLLTVGYFISGTTAVIVHSCNAFLMMGIYLELPICYKVYQKRHEFRLLNYKLRYMYILGHSSGGIFPSMLFRQSRWQMSAILLLTRTFAWENHFHAYLSIFFQRLTAFWVQMHMVCIPPFSELGTLVAPNFFNEFWTLVISLYNYNQNPTFFMNC